MSNKKPEFKAFNLEVKEMKDDGSFTGYTSIFGNVDSGNDRVHKGAFLRSINAREQSKFNGFFPVLFAHDYHRPAIGQAKFKEDDKGLFTFGKLFIDVWEDAKGIFYNMKNLVSNSMSFMFDTLKYDYENFQGKDIRNLREVKIFETSILNTGFSMNELADIEEIKSKAIESREIETRLKTMEKTLISLSKNTYDEEFKDKINQDLKALQETLSQLVPKKDTFDNLELAEITKSIQALTSRIKSDLKI